MLFKFKHCLSNFYFKNMNRYGLIYATTTNGAFSRKSCLGLPWKKNTLDLKIFKALTLKTNVVMGRLTMESLKLPLPNRENYVITKGDVFEGFKKTTFEDIKNNNLGIVWFIGGTSILEKSLELFDPEVIVHNEIKEIIEDDVNFFIEPKNGPTTSLQKLYEINVSDNLVSHIYGKKIKNEYSYLDNQYLDILYKLINSEKVEGRNGLVYSIPDESISITANEKFGFPIIQSKFTWFKGVKSELDFFMEGKTNSKILENQGNYIWMKNTSRKFLDDRNLKHYEEGDMGPMYGFKWRHYGEKYVGSEKEYKGYDQINFIVDEIVNNPHSRRLLMTTFDPTTVDQQVLCECHGIVTQFFVRGDYISLKTYQRSADWFLGVPFNISSYALLLRRIVKMVNDKSGKKYKPGKSITLFGDTHLYESHLVPAIETLVYSNFQKYDYIKLNNEETLINYNSKRIKAEMVE